MLYVVLGLIAVAHDGIILACSQIVKCLRKIVHLNSYTAISLYLIADVARAKKCYCLSLNVAEVETAVVCLAVNHLIIQAENRARVEYRVLAIWRIHHHRQVGSAVKHICSHLCPQVGRVIELYAQSRHQCTGKVHVVSTRYTISAHRLQWRIVGVKSYSDRLLYRKFLSPDSARSQQPYNHRHKQHNMSII